MNKICVKCGIKKDLSNFSKMKSEKSGYNYYCKTCKKIYAHNLYLKNREIILKRNRNSKLIRDFNITLEEYNKLFQEQNGICAICDCLESRIINKKISTLAVDHNHITGKIRGLLCNNCNQALGKFKDNINILQSAIKYLQK